MFRVYYIVKVSFFTIISALAISFFFTQTTAYAESEISILTGKNSYRFNDDDKSFVVNIEGYKDFFVSKELIFGDEVSKGDPAGHPPLTPLTFRCDNSGKTYTLGAADFYAITAHPPDSSRQYYADDLKDPTKAPEKVVFRIYINGSTRSSLAKEGACEEAWDNFSLKGGVISDRKEGAAKAHNQVLDRSIVEKAKNNLTPLVAKHYSTWQKRVWNTGEKPEGCSTIGNSLSCDQDAFNLMVARCYYSAVQSTGSGVTVGGNVNAAIKEKTAACLSRQISGNESLAKRLLEDDLKNFNITKMQNEVNDDLNNAYTDQDANKTDPQEEATCASQGLVAAWVLCPLLDGAIKLADWSWSLFEVMLAHNPIRQYKLDDQGKPTTEETGYYTTWSYVRNIANVALVLLFLFVIYSQITGYGISNYGIKQSLPRIIVIAILINVSFFLIQIAFDIASVVGATMDDMIAGQVKAIPSLENLSGDIIKTGALGLSGGAIALGAVAVAGPSTAMLFFTLLILPGVVALIAGFFTVLMRNALLPIVAVLGPLALVAYVLPNTASLFEKWKKTFTSLLFLYPTAAIYYAALKAAAIMMIGDENPDATLQRLMGFALLLFGSGFIVILAIKSNAITGKIMGGAQGILSRMASPIEKIGRDTMSAMALDKMGAFRSQDFGNKSRWNPKRYIGKSMQSLDRRSRDRKLRTALRSSEADQQYNQGVLADTSRLGGLDKTIGGQAYINKLQSDAVANKEISLRNEDINSLGRILENAIKSGDAVSARAAQKSLLGSGAPGVQKLQNTLSAVENSGIGQDNSVMSGLRQDINSAGIKDRDAVLATWAYQNGKTIDQVRSDADTYSGLTAVEAAGQGVENLAAGVASGGITTDMVKRIDGSDAAQIKITGNKNSILEPLREKRRG